MSGQCMHSNWTFTLTKKLVLSFYYLMYHPVTFYTHSSAIPALTFPNTHGSYIAPLQKFVSRAPAKPGLGSVSQNILRTEPYAASEMDPISKTEISKWVHLFETSCSYQTPPSHNSHCCTTVLKSVQELCV